MKALSWCGLHLAVPLDVHTSTNVLQEAAGRRTNEAPHALRGRFPARFPTSPRMASKKRRQEEEDEIMLADPEDAEVDVLMASPVQHSLLGLDGDELLASNAASIVGMDEPMKRPMAPVMPPPPAPADAENAPRRKKDEWMRKAGGDLQLPLMRVKRVVKSDKDIKHINTAAIVVLSKATVRKIFVFVCTQD